MATAPSSKGPAMILIPSTNSFNIPTLSGGENRHFISEKEFAIWSKAHPSVRPITILSPVNGATTTSTTATTTTTTVDNGKGLKNYKAPQHPASHLLHSIPPRAPVRSTRSNILSYTLHLATTSRLSAYSSSTGTGHLLHLAESNSGSSASASDTTVSENWLEDEQKAAGLWKVGVNLLKAIRKEGELATAVERRFTLAGLVEEMLASPIPALSIAKVSESEIRDSSNVDAVKALAPLTSPDNTILYSSLAPYTRQTTSIAQSLIDMKFGKVAEEETPQLAAIDSKPTPPSISNIHSLLSSSSSSEQASAADAFHTQPSAVNVDSGRQSETVFASASNPPPSAGLTAAPHMDYRIVRGQAMRSRAKETFATSILPMTSSIWCRRHRINTCTVCNTIMEGLDSDVSQAGGRRSKLELAGQGLASLVGGGNKKPLVELVPAFIVFSAALLKDLRERQATFDHEEREYTVQVAPSPDINGTAAWYSLLHSLVIQAVLEGYLVDGWVGTKAIETLFGCGCGVWEGKGWASRVAQSENLAAVAKAKSLAEQTMMMDLDDNDSSDEESDSDEEVNEEELREAEREREKMSLIDAAQALFGSRDAHQADFEKSMRDRIQEFLDIPQDTTLIAHLNRLNAKYPLSSFERDMVDFLESTATLLGKPALAKYETQASSTSGVVTSNDPDPYALIRYFSRTESAEASMRNWEANVAGNVAAGKRRRMD